ncbi:MAG: septum site-determining protein MinD [Anaerofustis stercorihominis]|nr:septum site-determining protein MinD [Anaerofustis stercorihominis]
MSKVIVVTSGKGGVGKTTCTANIGIALSFLKKSVAVIDADIGLRNLDMVLGLEEKIMHNILDVISGKINIRQALIHDERYPGFYLLPASQHSPTNIINPQVMTSLVNDIRNDFDYILIDCPAGIENGFYSAVTPADEAIVVVTPEISSIRDADRITQILSLSENAKISLIVNRVNHKMIDSGDMISVEDITDILGITLLGVIPEDKSVIISSNKGIPVCATNSPVAKQFKNIARRITGSEVSIEMFRPKERFADKLAKIFSWG